MLPSRVTPVKPHLSAGYPGCYNHAMQADPRVGTELAGHRIEAVIGRGAMAVVYLARHLRLGRQVALKVLDPALAEDEAFRERFIRDCRAAAALDHPNVVTVYDAGEADGVLYLSMRYVEGTDLERLLEVEGYLSPEVALSIVVQCAAALDAAHAEGLVHRGVVPAAILLERGWMDDGRAFLADFGITKHVAASTRMTRTGSFAGSVDYVAPEEIRGDDDVDGRADVYSLGCVLYRCLTGEVPFPRDSELVTIYAHLEDPPPRPSDARSDLPPAMDGVIARALAKSREQRYADVHGSRTRGRGRHRRDLAAIRARSTRAAATSTGESLRRPTRAPERNAGPSVRRGRRRCPPPRGARRDVGWFCQSADSIDISVDLCRLPRHRPGRPSSPRPVRSRAHPRLPSKTPTIAGTTRPRAWSARETSTPFSRSGTISTRPAAIRTTPPTTTRGGDSRDRSRSPSPATANTARERRRGRRGTSSTSASA